LFIRVPWRMNACVVTQMTYDCACYYSHDFHRGKPPPPGGFFLRWFPNQ